ncbi:MAG TPA: TonB family protein [Candidatus Acidoferrum sp.]|nr:TonB family protein [Candidatus Acidoferrum sp.]
MSLGQINGGYNLLGQAGAATAARMAPIAEPPPAPEPIAVEPKLDIRWGDFHQGFFSSVRALFSVPFAVKNFLGGDYFRDCWVERRIPMRAVFAAALWHIFFLVSPFSLFKAVLPHNSAFDNTQLTWSGPIEDFPTLEIPAAKPKPTPRAEAENAIAPNGADAFHPRQRIIVDPVHPTHPRQTLINPAAPQLAPKLLPALPNIVQLQSPAAPPRPHIEISAKDLAKLHPRQRRVATVTATPLPDVPTFELKPADITLTTSPNAPARPKLDLNAASAPRIGERAQSGDSVPAPEIAAAQSASANGNPSTLIALSDTPAPPKPDVQPPQGNLSARVSISPEGTKRGVPGGAPDGKADPASGAGTAAANHGGGTSPVGVSISGGNPQPNAGASSLGNSRLKLSLPSSRDLAARPEPNSRTEDTPQRTGPPNFAMLPPGAKPEQVFADKRVFTLNVNMANLTSASGSWILHFSELDTNQIGPRGASVDLTGLAPIHKVDPKYPPELIEQNVEGEVILYAIIRADGSVDSIQLVRSVDPVLDANAKNALSQWKFRPAMKNGAPVALEAIVYVPFRLADNR